MTRAAVNLFIIMLALRGAIHAADKPIWTLDARTLGVPEMWRRNLTPEVSNSTIRLQFSAANDVMVSFRQHRTPEALAHRDVPANSSTTLVLLLVAKTDGRLIGRSDLPVIGEEDLSTQFHRGSRLEPLPSGGYVGFVSGYVRVMDSSLRVLYERALGELRPHCEFALVTPLSGSFFVLEQQCDGESNDSAELIDSRTFTTVERWDMPGLRVVDIWGDRLLAVRETEHARYTSAVVEADPIHYRVQEKRIGGPWLDTGLTVDGYAGTRFTNDGAIAVARRLAKGSAYCDCWSITGRWAEGGPSVCNPSGEHIRSIASARQSPIIAVGVAKLSGLRSVLDMDGLSWVVVHSLETRRELLATQSRDDMVDYALSSDARYLAVLTEKRLEMYSVPTAGAGKK